MPICTPNFFTRLASLLLVIGGAAISAAPVPGHAQPAPSFKAACGELRAALEKLGPAEEKLVTIDVIGTLTAVEHDGTLGYMVTCSPPDPQVLCITYEINDYEVGDEVILSGGLNRESPDHVRLDPCLHYPPDGECPALRV